MEKEIVVSIIIPTFNRTTDLEKCIKSIVDQQINYVEIIVVDDGSNKRTIEFYNTLSRKYSFKLIHRNNIPKGANMCRNIGYEHAKGTYIKWLDSDDELLPNTIDRQLMAIGNNDVVVGNADVHNWTDGYEGRFFKKWSKKLNDKDLANAYAKGQVRWQTGTPLWRKSFFRNAPFDKYQMNAQEFLMHSMALLQKPRIIVMEDSIVKVNFIMERMSDLKNRNSRYLWHQGRARRKLLFKKGLKLKTRIFLLKLSVVYSFKALLYR